MGQQYPEQSIAYPQRSLAEPPPWLPPQHTCLLAGTRDAYVLLGSVVSSKWLGSVVTLLTKHLAPSVQAPPAELGVRGDATLQTPAFTDKESNDASPDGPSDMDDISESTKRAFDDVLTLLKFCCHRTNGLQGRKVASPETLALGQTSLSLFQASDQVAGAGRLRVVSSGEVRNYKSVKQTTLSLTMLPPRGHWMPLKQ
ncbi:hypothetical protein HPB47_000103 [Ixodes persulcatus]|uniref:Uncharacterized protein n=1 Tax=Ixodes persulcatus TaxID=34615 RepID=A0AC60PU80_IXOPE|nr:hypothetical protein HPB47_000103 [Ixodes persulcatus]